MKPVVFVRERDLLASVLAGASRAGREPTIRVVARGQEMASLFDDSTHVEMVVVSIDDRATTVGGVTRLLERGARPIPSLFVRSDIGVDRDSLAWMGELPPGLNVAVPSLAHDGARGALWACLRETGVAERHHLIEVDGRPGLDGSELVGRAAELDRHSLLGAGAAGVLAGRMVVAGRTWHASLPDQRS